MRVAPFVTCINDALYPRTGKAVVHLLERLGHEMAFPAAQTCCGQMHVNTGYHREAVPLAHRFLQVFDPYKAIVSPSPSCAGTVRESYERIAQRPGDEALARSAARIVPRVRQLSEFLVDVLGVQDVGAHFPHRVTYHRTCHSLRGHSRVPPLFESGLVEAQDCRLDGSRGGVVAVVVLVVFDGWMRLGRPLLRSLPVHNGYTRGPSTTGISQRSQRDKAFVLKEISDFQHWPIRVESPSGGGGAGSNPAGGTPKTPGQRLETPFSTLPLMILTTF